MSSAKPHQTNNLGRAQNFGIFSVFEGSGPNAGQARGEHDKFATNRRLANGMSRKKMKKGEIVP
jgi:hypothetical protein